MGAVTFVRATELAMDFRIQFTGIVALVIAARPGNSGVSLFGNTTECGYLALGALLVLSFLPEKLMMRVGRSSY
jgi:hypothetical protein